MENFVVPIAVTFAVLLAVAAAWVVRTQRGLRRVTESLVDAEEALDRGELARARDLVSPLLARFPTLPVVQEVAADTLYASGDPLSAASLLEQAMKRLGPARVAPRLVAAYAALNRAGDARRVAALAPDDALVRITLAWCELAADGGDREHGRALAEALAKDAAMRDTPSYDAMASALVAIAAGRAGDLVRMRASLDHVAARGDELAPQDRAFVGYLIGVARREAGDTATARAIWTAAMDVAPESIGAALARRERSHLPAP